MTKLLLLDTNILIWLIEAPQRISRSEQRILGRYEKAQCVSAVSLWEMRIKWDSFDRRGHRKGSVDPAVALAFAENSKIDVAPLTPEAAIASLGATTDTADPFDEMLLIHAQHLGARILTRDQKMLEHPLALHP